MGGIFWVIVSKQYPHIATIYEHCNKCKASPKGQFKASPHSTEHTSVQKSQPRSVEF